MRIWFDMETGDPDDFLTLAWLCGHPEIELAGVTITPGTPHQVGVVRYCLDLFGLDVPVGVFNMGHKKALGTPEEHYVSCVSDWHYKSFGDIPPSEDAETAWEIMAYGLNPETTLLTGGPLKNLGALLRNLEDDDPLTFPWVGQGGFAGEGVVPDEDQLEKFKGMVICPTYNFNGDPKSAVLAFESPHRFTSIRLVSKNVCHGVYYDQTMHERFEQSLKDGCVDHKVCGCPCHEPGAMVLHVMACCHPCRYCGVNISGISMQTVSPQQLSRSLIHRGMTRYLSRHSKGKKFHDPLAAACALDPSIGTWANVQMYHQQGQWGCFLMPDSKVQIITKHDHERFIQVLLGGAM